MEKLYEIIQEKMNKIKPYRDTSIFKGQYEGLRMARSEIGKRIREERNMGKQRAINNYVIGLDFDGTVVTHEYPEVGVPVPHCIRVLKRVVEKKHKIILNTMRGNVNGKLDDAVEYLLGNDIPLYGANHNKNQSHWTDSPKIFAHVYIDDASVNCPLILNNSDTVDPDYPISDRPYVDWLEVERLLEQRGII